MVEMINGIDFTVKYSSHVEKYYACGDKLIHHIAQIYDSEGTIVAQGGSPVGRMSALSHARKNFYERYGSYANGTLDPKKSRT